MTLFLKQNNFNYITNKTSYVKQWYETHSIFYNFNLSINWVLVSIPMAQPTELSSVTVGVDWGNKCHVTAD
jgi:hypothetical protein